MRFLKWAVLFLRPSNHKLPPTSKYSDSPIWFSNHLLLPAIEYTNDTLRVDDVALGVQFNSRGQKSRGNLPISVNTAQTMTDYGFWRLVTILPSVDDEEPQSWSFYWFTTCWMSNFFRSTRGSAECRRSSPGGFPAFLGSHGHMIGTKLLAMQYLEWRHP